MKLVLRQVTSLDEALGLAPALDRSAAGFMAQFSDDPYPEGAAERCVRRHFAAPQFALVAAEIGDGSPPCGLCLVAPFEDPLLGTALPMILVLEVDEALRHRGVAGELVREVESILAARGMRSLAARAGHTDDALISMGERWGFVRSWELMVKE